MPHKKLTIALTLSGALPFYLALAAMMADMHPDFAIRAFLTYGAVIASFMAGAVWGVGQAANGPRMGLLVVSNLAALAIWASLLLAPDSLTLAVQILTFIAILAADGTLARTGDIKPWYWTLRQAITALVGLAYLGAFFLF